MAVRQHMPVGCYVAMCCLLQQCVGTTAQAMSSSTGTPESTMSSSTWTAEQAMSSSIGTTASNISSSTGTTEQAMLSSTWTAEQAISSSTGTTASNISSSTGTTASNISSSTGTTASNISSSTGTTEQAMSSSTWTTEQTMSSSTGTTASAMSSSTGTTEQAMSPSTGTTEQAMSSSTGTTEQAMSSSTGATASKTSSSTGTTASAMSSSTGTAASNTSSSTGTTASAMSSSTGTTASNISSSTGTTASAMSSSTGTAASAMSSSTGTTASNTSSSTGTTEQAMSSSTGTTASNISSSTGTTASAMSSSTGTAASAMSSSTGTTASAMSSSTGTTASKISSSTGTTASAMSSSTGTTASNVSSSTGTTASAMSSSTGTTASNTSSSRGTTEQAMSSSTGTTASAMLSSTGTTASAMSSSTGTTASAMSSSTGTTEQAMSSSTGTEASVMSSSTGTTASAMSSSTGTEASVMSSSTGTTASAMSSSTGTVASAMSSSTGTISSHISSSTGTTAPAVSSSADITALALSSSTEAKTSAISSSTETTTSGVSSFGSTTASTVSSSSETTGPVVSSSIETTASALSSSIEASPSVISSSIETTASADLSSANSTTSALALSSETAVGSVMSPATATPASDISSPANTTSANATLDTARCEEIAVDECQMYLPYRETSFPNSFFHMDQQSVVHAAANLSQYARNLTCHHYWGTFYCATLLPKCDQNEGNIRVLPCRDFCQSIFDSCSGPMSDLGLLWPDHWNCTHFPTSQEKLCITEVELADCRSQGCPGDAQECVQVRGNFTCRCRAGFYSEIIANNTVCKDVCEADNVTGSHSSRCIQEVLRQVGCRAAAGSSLVSDVMAGNRSVWTLEELRSYFSGVKARADMGDSMSANACYQEGCEDGWFYGPDSVSGRSSCYLLVTNTSAYRGASAACGAQGAYLASVASVTEGSFLLSLLQTQNITMSSYVGLLYQDAGNLNDTSWEDGSSLSDDMNRWLQSGLKTASGHSWCVELCGSCFNKENSSAWNSVSCEERRGSICEKAAVSDIDEFPDCSPPLVRCPEDGQCLTGLNVCDGVSHCETIRDETNCSVCEEVDFGICQDFLNYSRTSFPNAFGHSNVADVFSNASSEFFTKVLNLSFHETLPKFLCSTLFPECQSDGLRVLPCRDLCDEVKLSYLPEMQMLGLSWPAVWDCTLLPTFGHGRKCFRGYDAGCSSPSVELVGAAPEFECVDMFSPDGLQLTSRLTLNCTQNVKVRYEWTLEYAVLAEDLIYPASLPQDATLDLYDLVVESNVLEYGILGVKVNASICGDSDDQCNNLLASADALACFIVVPSTLVAQLAGGSSRSIPSGSDVILDASQSHDPDANLTSQELSYDWDCELTQTGGGCGLPAGTLDIQTSTLEVLGDDLLQGEAYTFSVLVSYPGRTSSERVTQTLTILEPDAPTVEISCKSNCDVRVNPSERLVIESTCTNCAAGDSPSYAWSLAPDSLSETVQQLDWTRTTTGSTTASLGIKSGTFQGAETYTARVDVTRAGVTGFAEFVFTTNSPPTAGTCEVSPWEGTELTDQFSIQCTGFSDPDTPLTYEFSYLTGSENIASFSTAEQQDFIILGTSAEPALEGKTLPAGLESKNYAVTVRVTARDALGAETSATFNVTVRTISDQDFSDTVAELILGDDSKISEAAGTGDIQAVVSLATSVGTSLNTQSETAGQTEASREERETLREELLTRWVSEAADTVRTLESVKQVASCISAVSATKDELSTNAQLGGAASLSRITETLVEQAAAGSGTDAVEDAAKMIITGLVNIMQASSLTSLSARNNGNDTSKTAVLTQTETASTSVLTSLRGCTRAVFSMMTTGQEPVVISADGYNMVLRKQECSGLAGLVIRTSTDSDNWFKLPDNITADVYGNSSGCGDVDTEMSGTDFNPYEHAESSAGVSSHVTSLSLLGILGEDDVSGLSQPIDMMISRGAASTQSETAATAQIGSGRLSVHNVTSTFGAVSDNSVFIQIEPLLSGFPINLYLKNGANVTYDDYDMNISLPLDAALLYTVELPDRTESSDDHSWLIQPEDVSNFNGSEWFLGVAHEIPAGTGPITNPDGQTVQPADFMLNYTITVFSSTCLYFDNDTGIWKGDGCKTGSLTTPSRTHCLCDHLTPFSSGSSFFVAPNSIDIVASILAFSSIASNPGVVIAIAVILFLYILVIIWARRKDKKDLEKVGVTVLPGVAEHQYCYIVTVYTGFKRFAGTSAKVAVIVTGENGQSEAHILMDPKRKVFETAGVDSFLLTTDQPLGALSSVHVWHDNSGDSPSWFLDQITVYDLEEEQKYIFICNRWLAEDDDDGMTERHMPVASETDLKDFYYVFSSRMSKDFRDGHLWFSVAGRPARSPFTRVQRVSCCLSLLLATMVVNIAFFGVADSAQSTDERFDVGGVSFTWTEIMISIQSALIVLPINLAIVQIFRTLKVRPSTDVKQPTRLSSGKRDPNGAAEKHIVCGPDLPQDGPQREVSPHSSRFLVSEVDMSSRCGEDGAESVHELPTPRRSPTPMGGDEQVLNPHTPEPPAGEATACGNKNDFPTADELVIRCNSLPSLKIRVRSSKTRSFTQTDNYADTSDETAEGTEIPESNNDTQAGHEVNDVENAWDNEDRSQTPRFRQIIQQNKSLLRSEITAERSRLVSHLVARNTLSALEKEAIHTLAQKETEEKVNTFLLRRLEQKDEGAFFNFCSALTHGARQGYLSELLKAGDREDLPALLDYLYAAALHIAGRPTADIMWRVFPRHLGLSDDVIESCHRQNRYLQHKVLHCLVLWYINQAKPMTPPQVIGFLNSVHETIKCSCKELWIWEADTMEQISVSTAAELPKLPKPSSSSSIGQQPEPTQPSSGASTEEHLNPHTGKVVPGEAVSLTNRNSEDRSEREATEDSGDAAASISFDDLDLDMPPRPHSAGEVLTTARMRNPEVSIPESAGRSRPSALSRLSSSEQGARRGTSPGTSLWSHREDEISADGFFEIQFSEPGNGVEVEAGTDAMYKSVEFKDLLQNTGDRTSLDIPSTGKKKKEQCLLPWWFLFIGWFLVFAVCVVSAFFTLLYGNSYGKTKAEAWLLTFFTSFLLDVVILQPVKVLVVAVALAFIVKSVDTGDDDAVAATIRDNDELLHISTVEYASIEPPKPPVTDPQKLAAARELRAKRRRMYSVMVEVIFYFLFVWVVVSIANGHRSESAFFQNNDVRETFLAPPNEDDGFEDIGQLDDLWTWLEEGLLPGLTETWYNDAMVDSSFTAGLVHYLVGVVRLRQMRVRSDAECKISPSVVSIVDDCNVEYSWENEDTRAMNNAADNQTSPWVYQTASALNGYPFWGSFALYAGGGYVAELGTTTAESLAIIEDLKNNTWIDDNTRAVLVEFTSYNAYVNLFTVVTLALEFPVSGGMFPLADIQTVRLYNYTSQYTLYVMACQILYVIMLLFYLYREVKELREKKWRYFHEFWNWIELAVALLSVCAIGLFAWRMVITDRITAYRRSNPGRFINYSEAVFWDAVYGYVIAFIATLVIAKFVKLLRFNRRMSLLGDTIKNTTPKVLGFIVIYIVVIMAFAQAVFLVLGNTSSSFGTFMSCLKTLWNVMLGDFDFSEFWDGHRVLGPAIWFSYVLTSNCILVFTFVAIIMDSYENVKKNINKQSNDHEIVDFMIKQFKDYTGWNKKKRNVISPGPRSVSPDHDLSDKLKPQTSRSRESWADKKGTGDGQTCDEMREKNMKDPFYSIL